VEVKRDSRSVDGARAEGGRIAGMKVVASFGLYDKGVLSSIGIKV
jgi:hypothetical protein